MGRAMRTRQDVPTRDARVDQRFDLKGAKGVLIYKYESLPCEFIDISLSGCCVRTRDYFEPGALTAVEVALPLLGIQVKLSGVTQWVGRNRLIGVRFRHPNQRAKNELAGLLSGLVDPSAAAVVKDAVSKSPDIKARGLALSKGMLLLPQQAPPPKAPELPEPDQKIEDEWQATYKRWAEQDRLEGLGSQVDHAPATELQPTEARPDMLDPTADTTSSVLEPQAREAPSTPAPDRPVPCTGPAGSAMDGRLQNTSPNAWNATVRFLANDKQESGVLADLGLAGCIFNMIGSYPGQVASSVEVEFQLRGLHFRMAGVTTGLVNADTAQITFSEISRRRREELLQVLDELRDQNEPS